MKREKLLSCLAGAILAFALAMAGIGCLVTAFGLKPVNMAAITAICGIWALICAVCVTARRGVLVLAAGVALMIGYLLREGSFLLQIEAFLFKISGFYNSAYGWDKISWSGLDLTQVPMDGALLLTGAVVILLTVMAVCRRKTAFFAAVVGFLPLAACFVVTDTIPAAAYIWLMAASMILLLMPQSVRKKDPKAGLRLTAMLLIPVMLATMLLFWLNPQKSYTYKMDSLQDAVIKWVSDLPFVQITPDGNLAIGDSGAREDLTRVGPKTLRRFAVMDVVAPKSGLIYLRGQSLDIYSGTGWDASQVSTGRDMFFPEQNMERIGRLRVSMRIPQSRMYIPYYMDGSYEMVDGAIENEGSLREYGYWLTVPMDGYKHISGSVTVDVHRPILNQSLQLPAETRAAAEAILDEIFAAAMLPMPRDTIFYDDTTQKAELIRDYVQDSARYSLDTPTMPQDKKDFAIWFLQESETGYCVHFATALTVLLRAAGIPARYVTGYTFEANGATATVVRASDAHAWVEYLDPNTGWTVLDATPAVWMEQEDTETTQPTQTDPEETEPVETESTTLPTESTIPDTQPDATIEATSPVGGEAPGDTTKTDISWLWTAGEILLWVVIPVAVLFGQYGIRRAIRRRRMRSGRRNKRALYLWLEAKRMARITGKTAPEELKELAEKAKFSQHTLTAAELQAFDLWLEQARNILREKPWIVRLAIRLIWAVE